MALALGDDADEHVGARHFLAPRCLHMHDRALHDALERIRRLRVARRFGNERLQFGVEILDKPAAQLFEIDRTGAHDRRRVAIVDKRQQEMLERREFVAARIGVLKRAMQRAFEILESDVNSVLLFLHGALEGMAMLLREVHHQAHLGLRNLVRIDAADLDAFVVNVKHDGVASSCPLLKYL